MGALVPGEAPEKLGNADSMSDAGFRVLSHALIAQILVPKMQNALIQARFIRLGAAPSPSNGDSQILIN